MKKIYYNGTLITMDENMPEAEAVCIEDGRIIKVGSNSDVLSLKNDEDIIIDLKKKTMLPGFIDAHSHFIGFANSLAQCDLSEANSFKDIIVQLKKFIEEKGVKAGEWVYGFAYDHNFLDEKRHPDKFLLDNISKEHPILIAHASSHMGVVNTKALELMKLDAHVEDPQGGKYGRVEGSKELNGFMEENAFINLQNKIPMNDMKDMLELIMQAQKIYASYGITTVQEGMVAKPLFEMLRYVSSKKLWKLDIIGYIDLKNCRELTTQYKEYVNVYHNRFKIGGYKIFLDGSPQGRTAWMSKPYAKSDDVGYPVLEDKELYELIEEAMHDKRQLLAHCNGDAAAQQYITQFEKVHDELPELSLNRPVMIHAQLVRKDQLKRMQKLQMIPSFFVAHTYFWGDIHIQNFGMERATYISPAKDAKEFGLPFTFHQDSPVLKPNIMQSIWCAVNRITKKGISIGNDQCVCVYDALKAVTIHGAYQYFEEDKKGSITEGKIADLVILERNPFVCNPEDLADIKIVETIKEGETIYRWKE